MHKVTRNRRARSSTAQGFQFKNCSFPAATARSHSADTNLPDLTCASTIFIAFSACVLKFPVWHIAFVSPPPPPPHTHTHKHTHTHTHNAMQVSADNNFQRESLTKCNISKSYKNVLHWLKDHTLGVKIMVTKCARIVVRCVM